MAAKKKVFGTVSKDDLAHSLADIINKEIKGDKVAHFLDGETVTPTDVTEWVSTGSSMLDVEISNMKHGGLPVGKIVEVLGLEASGKSLLCAHAIKATQDMGGLGVYIDTESAMNRAFVEAIGVKTDQMLYIQLSPLERIFKTVEDIITQVRSQSKDRLVTIVVDSVMGSSTENELAGDYQKDGWATDKAIIISKAMRKMTNLIAKQRILLIFTNQLRQKLGVTFGDPWTTSGGKALAFHASVRLRLYAIKQLKVNDVIVGIQTKAKVVKNRVGPPLRETTFNIYFDRGIDDYGSWLEIFKKFKIVKTSGAWYSFEPDFVSEELWSKSFQSKDFDEMMTENKELRELLYDLATDKMIMKYKSNKFGIDDIQESSEPVPE